MVFPLPYCSSTSGTTYFRTLMIYTLAFLRTPSTRITTFISRALTPILCPFYARKTLPIRQILRLAVTYDATFKFTTMIPPYGHTYTRSPKHY